MKKIFSMILVVAMIFALSVPAFAATTNVQDGRNNPSFEFESNNKGTVSIATSAPVTVYYVKTTWDDLTFTYSNATWDPETLTYIDGTWDKETATIKVENRSNAPVNVSSAIDTNAKNGVSVSLENPSTTTPLASAALEGSTTTVEAVTYGPIHEITVKITGTPKVTTGFEVGTVTVTLSKVA